MWLFVVVFLLGGEPQQAIYKHPYENEQACEADKTEAMQNFTNFLADFAKQHPDAKITDLDGKCVEASKPGQKA